MIAHHEGLGKLFDCSIPNDNFQYYTFLVLYGQLQVSCHIVLESLVFKAHNISTSIFVNNVTFIMTKNNTVIGLCVFFLSPRP
jgi:hypothetical protein